MTGNKLQKTLTSIVAVDRNGAIGCRNELPWKLKSDMKFFRENTIGNAVIMGRKTYDSIGCCLPRRTNIVLSHNNVLFDGTDHCQLALSIPEAMYRAASSDCDEIFVIGGALTYNQFAPLVDRYLVTVVDYDVPDADAFLDPDVLAQIEDWGPELLSKTEAMEGVDEHPFVIYEVGAPDIEERAKARAELISRYSEGFKKPAKRKSSAPRSSFSQDAFAF